MIFIHKLKIFFCFNELYTNIVGKSVNFTKLNYDSTLDFRNYGGKIKKKTKLIATINYNKIIVKQKQNDVKSKVIFLTLEFQNKKK